MYIYIRRPQPAARGSTSEKRLRAACAGEQLERRESEEKSWFFVDSDSDVRHQQ